VGNVALRIDGREYVDWKSVSLSRHLDESADSFTFRAGPSIGARSIPARTLCEILEGGDTFCTGRIEVPHWTLSTRALEYRGRSLIGDLVTWDAEPGTYPNLSLLQLAETLAEPFRIVVMADDDGGKPIPLVTVEPGEKVIAVLEREARPKGYLLVSDPVGMLRLMRPGMNHAHDVLEPPDVEEMELEIDGQQRPGVVRVRNELAWSSDAFGTDAQHEASVSDATTRAARQLIITSEVPGSAEDARDRALYEMATRLAKSVGFHVTVPSWRQSNGDPWEPGLLVTCRCEWMELDTEMLISDAEYTAGAEEKYGAVLTLKPPEAYLYGDPRLWGKTKRARKTLSGRPAAPRQGTPLDDPWWEDAGREDGEGAE